MRSARGIAAAAGALALIALPLAAQAQDGLTRFGWFASLIGSCWFASFPDGKTRHTQCYTAQFDQYMRGTATLAGEKDGAHVTQFSGDSVYAWDEKSQRIVYYIWGSNGSHGRHVARYEGEDLVFPIEDRRKPGTISYRSLWHRVDADSFEVSRQVPEGAGWRTELKVSYRRSPLVAIP